MHGFALIGLFLLATAFLLPGAARADNNLVQNGGFESGDFSNWSITGDVPGAQITTNDPHSGQYAAQFQADSYVYITQSISTPSAPGQGYNLLWWYNIHELPPIDMQVYWGKKLVYDYNTPGSLPWTEGFLSNLAPTGLETELTFGFLVPDPQSYFELDDISVTPSPTPEPGSLLLLGSGVLGLAGAVRRQLLAKRMN
jgi:hypothetical protein